MQLLRIGRQARRQYQLRVLSADVDVACIQVRCTRTVGVDWTIEDQT